MKIRWTRSWAVSCAQGHAAVVKEVEFQDLSTRIDLQNGQRSGEQCRRGIRPLTSRQHSIARSRAQSERSLHVLPTD